MAPADITGSVPATPVSLGAAAVWHVPELEGNPMPLGWALPAVTDDDLAAVAQWLDDPGLRATVQASVLNLSWHTYVIRVGDSTALVDTGLGNGKRRRHRSPSRTGLTPATCRGWPPSASRPVT